MALHLLPCLSSHRTTNNGFPWDVIGKLPSFFDKMWITNGCISDIPAMRGMRTLGHRTAVLGGAYNNSVQGCTDACLSLGYSLAGVEYGHECRTYYLSLRSTSAAHSLCFLKTAVPPSTVSLLRHPWLIVPCSAPEMAPSFVVVATALTCTTIPVPTKVVPPQALCRQQTFLEIGSIPDAWRAYALHSQVSVTTLRLLTLIHSEPGGTSRVFPYQIMFPQNNSVQSCLTQCSTFGYPAAGMENGDECCV
jgi:hypothetical protein